MPRILNAIVYPSLIPGPYPESLTRNKCHLMEALYGVVPYKASITLTLLSVRSCKASGTRPQGVNINSRLKGAVDRELGGNLYKKTQFSMFDGVAEKLFLYCVFLGAVLCKV